MRSPTVSPYGAAFLGDDVDPEAITDDDDCRREDSLVADSSSVDCMHGSYCSSLSLHGVRVDEQSALDNSSRPSSPFDILTAQDVLPIEMARSKFLNLIVDYFIAEHVIERTECSGSDCSQANDKSNKRKQHEVHYEGDPMFALPLMYIANLYETLVSEVNVRLASLIGFRDKTIGLALEASGGLYRKLTQKFPKKGAGFLSRGKQQGAISIVSMAMVLESFVKRCTASLEDFAGQEACAALGIGDDVRALLATLWRIEAIVSHEERRRLLSTKVDAWVAQLKDSMYEVDDVLDVCMIEGGKILADDHPPTPKARCSLVFSCFKHTGPRKFRHEIGFKVRDIDLRLREVEEEMPRLPAGSVHSDSTRNWFSDNICKHCHSGIKPQAAGAQVRKAVGGLVPRLLREGKRKVAVFAIVGAMGIGKTTLAREIYDDDRMTENFPICVWVKMSKDLSEVAFLKKIIRGAGANVGDTENKEELLGLLSSALSKRFLIVLDDLDSPGIWDNLLKDPLGDGVARGRILITTRNEEVATSMKATVHRVEKMDTESGWDLLCKQVLPECNTEELVALKNVGIKIVDRCEGHPLAIKVIAGLLRSRGKSKAEWETILRSDSWSMQLVLPEVPRALYVSYVHLPSELKECFLHCSLYPEECPIQRFDLVRHWIAEGVVNARDNKLLEESAEEYYVELISRNLLQPDPDNVEQCWITHDLLRALARFLISEESILIDGQQRLNTSSSKPASHIV
ncbi:hypothetical protein PR202_ga14292 [Eleusine coracana subsp. coracana]|uniref:Uncharacterized protein n=1 Tax=Eleusine coracana subsp. coracana TaxID=191504 RepID=A0AAV5CGY7_ELECO|nr:hypothetical protein PR202_ga14292 [Eleusine coracana subsp. coracana]